MQKAILVQSRHQYALDLRHLRFDSVAERFGTTKTQQYVCKSMIRSKNLQEDRRILNQNGCILYF